MSSVFRALHRAHAAARMPRRALLSTIPPRATFDAAVHALEVSGTELDDQQKLRLYGLFKAASGAGRPNGLLSTCWAQNGTPGMPSLKP